MTLYKQIGMILVILLSVASSFAKNEIREVEANDRVMKTIHLTLGRSTILRFSDRPVKVVSGNSNYFNVEYIGNDLTIQPLANVETNLFVYTQSKLNYGFHLKVGGSATYDDVVIVRWKSPFQIREIQKTRVDRKVSKPFPAITLKSEDVELKLFSVLPLQGTQTILLDFEIKNKSMTEIKLGTLDVFLSRNNERLQNQNLLYQKDLLRAHENCRGRILVPIEKKEDFSFIFVFKKKFRKVIVSKAHL